MSVDYSQTGAPPAAPPPAKKKGLGPLGWIAIGCGVIFVLVLIAMGACGIYAKHKLGQFSKNPEMATAKLIVSANPDLELVKADDDAKTLTVRDKKTGEEQTFNLADIKEGKFKFSGKEGTTTIDMKGGENGGLSATTTDEKGQESTFHMGAGSGKLPDWLPAYPGGSTQGTYDTTSPEGRSAAVVVTTTDSPDKVLDFYEAKLKEAGLTAEKTTSQTDGKTTSGSVSGASADQKRSVTVAVSSSSDGTQAMVSFNEKP
jgi:hypothetical protein